MTGRDYQVDTHIHYTVDDEGRPQAAYQTVSEAREAVESDDYWHRHEVEYYPDVPLMEKTEGLE